MCISKKKDKSEYRGGSDACKSSTPLDGSNKSIKKKDGDASAKQKATERSSKNKLSGSLKNTKPGKPNPADKWIQRALDMGVPKLVDEFRGLAKWTPEKMTVEAFNANKDKNRYQDVPCQDKGRVLLKFPGLSSDYIHANYVGTPQSAQRFICAQGPLENTQYSFWAMAIQEKVGIVIMLCNCVEMTKMKCHQYWPLQKGEKMTFGGAGGDATGATNNPIHVTHISSKRMELEQFIIVTTLKIEWNQESREILHYQWENWPDRGVPMTKLSAVNLLSAVRGNRNPILVHCSAGIGRTGTIVAIAYVLEKMNAGEDCMEMNELLKELREQRPWSIQNEFQYLYLHRVLLAYFLEKHKNLFEAVLAQQNNAEKYAKWCADYKSMTGGE